jgi:hypothetical protein
VWFSVDTARSRQLFPRRGGKPVAKFDSQVSDIQGARLPNGLKCVKVEALTNAATLRDLSEILREILGE